MSDIIEQISKDPKNITEEDIDTWIVPELLEYFKPKFFSLSRYAYGHYESDLAARAFKEEAVEVISKGTYVFFIKSKHWMSGRKVEPYLALCLNRLADNLKRELSSQKKKITVPVCPGCKSLGERSYLAYENRMLRCNACTNEQDKLVDRISKASVKEKYLLENELTVRKIFALHSRKGYRCPGCSNFIPKSFAIGTRVSCPYDKICDWFGVIDELESMSHPVGLSSDKTLSLNTVINQNSDGPPVESQDMLKSEAINADVRIEVRDRLKKEVSVLNEVLDAQYDFVKKQPSHKAIKKVLMYEAFKNMLKSNPEDMVSYLVHQKISSDLPIQARIFQEFINLVEDSLPLNIYFQGDIVEIYDLLDDRLDLFKGLSSFKATIRSDGTIPNLTQERYIGGRKNIDRGACFIGKLIDIRIVKNDQSIVSMVDYYTFSQIKMNDNVPPGLEVEVKHFRIPSHYEMHGLVYLQRIRKKIVNSVYLKLNGEKRIPKK